MVVAFLKRKHCLTDCPPVFSSSRWYHSAEAHPVSVADIVSKEIRAAGADESGEGDSLVHKTVYKIQRKRETS